MEWMEPPARQVKRGGRVKYAEERAVLIENPGKWALLETVPAGRNHRPLQTKSSYVKTARLSSFRPAGAFDARVAKLEDGRHGLFVKFNGGDAQ